MSEIQVANVWLSTGKTYGVLGSTADVVTIRTGSSDRLLINTTAFSINTGVFANGSLGSSGQALLTNGSAVYWGNPTNTPGSNTQVLFNDSGSSNASAGLVFDKASNNLTVANTLVAGNASVNSTLITIGNSTVNVFANGSHLDVTSNTGFLLGTFSATANGYTWMPNGLLLQWGSVNANSTTGNATFAIAFPTECLSVTANRKAVGANGFCAVTGTNTTVAVIRTANNTSTSCFYMAIGY